MAVKGVHDTQALALSPDGSRVAAATCEQIGIWDATTGKLVATIDYRWIGCGYGSGIGSSVIGMAFSPDNGLLAVSHLPMGTPKKSPPEAEGGFQVSLFRVRDGRRTRRWREQVYGLRFSPDSTLLAGYTDASRQLVLYNVQTGTRQELESGGGPVVFTPDGRLLVCREGLVDVSAPGKAAVIAAYDVLANLDPAGPYLLPKAAR